jgi:hypothetical protein
VRLGRGLVLAAIAVVLGIILLNVGNHGATPTAATSTTLPVTTTTVAGATTTTAPAATTTTRAATTTTARSSTSTTHGKDHGATTTTAPRSSVSVLTANGTSVSGAASTFSQAISSQGWNSLTPVDTTSPVSSSTVYYAAGQEIPALQIASYLGLKPTAVAPLTTSVPVANVTGADVVVVIGPDIASHPPAAAATTTT